MKSRIAVLSIAAVFMAVMAVPSFAAFNSEKTVVSTAAVSVGGTPIADFTLDLRDASNPVVDTNPPEITWTGVQSGDPWTLSNQCLLVNATVTDYDGGLQIYTDNKNAAANPQFVDPTPGDLSNADSMAAGLLHNDGTGTTSDAPLSLAWTIKSSSRTIEGGTDQTGVGAADPNTGPTGAVYNNKYQWLFFKDKGNTVDIPSLGFTQFQNAQKYVMIINVAGIHYGQDDAEFGAHPDGVDSFVYLEADFSSAPAGESYKTNRIVVEAFTQ